MNAARRTPRRRGPRPSRDVFRLRGSLRVEAVEAVDEVVEDAVVKFVAQHGVLDFVVDRRVVVDLDHHGPAVDEFQVHAVQSLADQRRGLYGGVEHFLRRLVDGYGLPCAAQVAACVVVGVVVDLPVALGHVVFAGEQRFAVQEADPPVELRGDELLGQQHGRVAEHLVERRAQLFVAGHLVHAHRERSVGNLEDEGRAEAFADLAEGVFVAAEQQLRGRGRDAGLSKATQR